eukprot:Nitzschia sp. Nitz4//scaffold115_size69933//41914//43113//NITZ4_006006-RA/size69933-snap-gene-0.83-mRNA-1//1//CDS//3329533511//3101//frame0
MNEQQQQQELQHQFQQMNDLHQQQLQPPSSYNPSASTKTLPTSHVTTGATTTGTPPPDMDQPYYVAMSNANAMNSLSSQQQQQQQQPSLQSPVSEVTLTMSEILALKQLLQHHQHKDGLESLATHTTMDSDYPQFGESTHAWAVYADDPKKRAGPYERIVGVVIIAFQLFAYRLFAMEAIEDFATGQVPVMVSHQDCRQWMYQVGNLNDDAVEAGNNNFDDAAWNGDPTQYMVCEAEYTNTRDAFVAFFMLGIFLSEDVLQAARVLRSTPWGVPWLFAALTAVEVAACFVAASIAVSYHLFVGEVTDAVEVGVGLLFIRELSQRTYAGLRDGGKKKQYRNFLIVLTVLVCVGMVMDPLTAKIFAGYIQ